MQRFEIYTAEHQWNDCSDPRPWLVVDFRPDDMIGCFPIASEHYNGSAFFIDSAAPDFPATGLTKSCYIHDIHIIEVPRAGFIKYRGWLEGELLSDFQEYSGIII